MTKPVNDRSAPRQASAPGGQAGVRAAAVPNPVTEGMICLGQIVAAHGVRGGLKVRSFTAEPGDVAAYGPLTTDAGAALVLRVERVLGPGMVLARADIVADRNAAEALCGTGLYVARDALPEPDDDESWYQADLIGLSVDLADGTRIGRVRAVHDFGAGDVLELELADGDMAYLPFTMQAVPEVRIAEGRLVADPPHGWREEKPAPAVTEGDVGAERPDDGDGAA